MVTQGVCPLLVSLGSRHPGIVDGDLFRRLCDARDLIHDRFDARLDLDTLARAAGVSRFHFLRSFQRAFGQTPHQRLIDVRLARAKDRLRAGAPVTDVCFDVGFSSLGSFSDLFRRRVGLPPSRYQLEVRRVVQVPLLYALFSIPFCFAAFFAPAEVGHNSATFEKRPPFRP
jgi:AraC-like DNA-binding protein